MDELFAVYKPKGPTSHDIIMRIRRITGERHVGHAGTLDPLASGVLVVGVGRAATRKLTSEIRKDKTYIAGGLFSFRGFRFLLFLMPQGPPSPLDGVWLDGEDVGKSQLNYHNRLIGEFSGKNKSQDVEIKW